MLEITQYDVFQCNRPSISHNKSSVFENNSLHNAVLHRYPIPIITYRQLTQTSNPHTLFDFLQKILRTAHKNFSYDLQSL